MAIAKGGFPSGCNRLAAERRFIDAISGKGRKLAIVIEPPLRSQYRDLCSNDA